jgi:hypothetical protein
MPIIIEGGSRCAGSWWSAHLQNTEKNERAQLVAVEGLSAETVPEMFREMHGMAMGSKAKNYFYQANINPRADEHLTPAQRAEAVATLGRNLGLDGQPHFVIEHEKNGRVHQHVVWLRVDMERMRAIPDSLTARVHEQTSRELETKFGLEPGKSVLVADRDFERPERLAKKHERFRGAQSGIDPHAVARELRTLREHSDGPASFRAGMEAAGYVLARGDRRDYVAVDQAGHPHVLSRGLGIKAAELRQYMQGIDPQSLPSVAEATTRQRARESAREARPMHGRPGQGVERPQENTPAGAPQNGDEAKAERPLNETQGAIRAAWSLSQTAEQLTEALAARGIGLAQVTAEEARANQRARAFAKEIGGRFVQYRNEGEIVAVNEKGHVYRFDPRTTGVERGEIDKRLAGIEAGSLLSVSDTRQAMREVAAAERAAARREAREKERQAREKARPLSRVEERIALAAKQSRLGVDAIRDGETVRLAGAEALAAQLDKAGIAVVRVSAADVQALDALRHDQELANIVADASGEVRRGYFPTLEEGEIAAVDRFGNVHRLNAERLDVHALLELGEDRVSSVTEARAQFEIDREVFAALREDMMGNTRSQFDLERGPLDPFFEWGDSKAGPEPDDNGARSPGDVAGGIAGGVERTLGATLDFVADFIAPPPPPTREQIRERNEAAKEARAGKAARQEKDERLQQTIDMSRAAARQRTEQEEEQERYRRERERGYERDR